jgi:hypothetical protein
MNKIAHIDIYEKQSIHNLKAIEFKICDSIYKFGIHELKDTICQNLAISDKTFPCSVQVNYTFNNGTTETFNATDFNCGGCSGTNLYILTHTGIEYQYKP